MIKNNFKLHLESALDANNVCCLCCHYLSDELKCEMCLFNVAYPLKIVDKPVHNEEKLVCSVCNYPQSNAETCGICGYKFN